MQLLNTFKLPKNFRGKNAFVVQLWWIVQGTFFRMSPQFMYGYRKLCIVTLIWSERLEKR